MKTGIGFTIGGHDLTEKENKNKNCQEDIFGCFDEIKSAIDQIYMFEQETGNVYGKGPRMENLLLQVFITHAKYIVAMTTKHFGRKNAKHRRSGESLA